MKIYDQIAELFNQWFDPVSIGKEKQKLNIIYDYGQEHFEAGFCRGKKHLLARTNTSTSEIFSSATGFQRLAIIVRRYAMRAKKVSKRGSDRCKKSN